MSDDSNEVVRVNHRVPEHIRDAAQSQTQHGELSEMVRELYQSVAFGTGWDVNDSVKVELERTRSEKDKLRGQIRTLQAQLETVEKKEARLEEKLQKQSSKEDRYEGHLESLESVLEAGRHIWDEHPTVEAAAKAGDVESEDVLAELKQRNPTVPVEQFEEKNGGNGGAGGFVNYD